MEVTDEVLLAKALKSGNQEQLANVFKQIYVKYAKLVSFCIAKWMDNRDTIQDLTNDVFLQFFNHAEEVSSSIKSYLCKIAKNKTFDYLKKEKNMIYNDKILEYFDTTAYQSAPFYNAVFEDLKTMLTTQELKIVELHAVEGYSFQEIAKIVKVTANHANVIYFRALQKFKDSKKGKDYEKR